MVNVMRKILIVSVLCLWTIYLYGQNNRLFNYPFSPSDKEWSSFKTVKDRKQALQIPDSIISVIATEELIDVCLNYPYLPDIICASNYDDCIKLLEMDFNGFCELFNRNDLAEAIVSLSQKRIARFKEASKYQEQKRIDWSIKELFIDLVARYAKEHVLIKKETQALDSEIFSRKRIINEFPLLFGSIYKNCADNILNNQYDNIPLKIKTLSSVDGWDDVNVFTPNGSLLQYTYKWLLEEQTYSAEDILYCQDYLNTNYNGAILLDMPTSKYNCHGYAWHVSEGGDYAWIGLQRYNYQNVNDVVDAEDVYWLDGSYIEVPESIATKVSYHRDGNHSAVRVSNNWYISKWSSGLLVKHHPNDVPSIYMPNLSKKFYIRNNFSILGSTVICGINTFSVENLPAGSSVTWSVNSSNFSVTPSGNQCTVSYTATPHYESAFLTATLRYNGQTFKTLTKRIVAHGTDMLVYGEQAIPGPGGGLPEINSSFYIPASAGSGLLRLNGASMMSSDTLTMHPIPILFEESNGQSLMLRDDPEYGITEIYGDAATLLTSNRFDGMTISFTGDKAPVYVTSNGSTTVGFKFQPASLLTDVQGYYNMVLHATSPGGCSDFDLYFKVIPQAGEAVGDDAISLSVGSTSLEVTFNNFEMIDLGNGMTQNVPWTLSIYKMATNTLVHSSTNYDMTKTVSMSGWTSGIYLVRVDCNGQRYSKKFLK